VTRVAVLTPPGTGAIATVEVSGPRAWEFARQLFRPAGKPLPESPELHRFWLGTLGDDEVILAVTAACGVAADQRVEIHCHGGRRVVRWVVEQFAALGCIEDREPTPEGSVLGLLSRAPTLRTASILLDQCHGAFDRAVRHILELLATDPAAALEPLRELTRYAHVGRHLVEPWNVVVAGAPNVGKSSLVNALAGYQRAVVSEVAGTTRDAVRVQVAFDGWPVELTDTAGLREAGGLEAEGIERARRASGEADLVLWVMDATDPDGWTWIETSGRRALPIVNKADLPSPRSDVEKIRPVLWVSAVTGQAIDILAKAIVRELVGGRPPEPGVAVPFTPRLADLVEAAHAALTAGRADEAARLLRDTLG
jgi:tRNA modification GTPase